MVQQMIGVAITDALKNVDCDLPPIGELCGPQSQVGKIGSSSVIFKKSKTYYYIHNKINGYLEMVVLFRVSVV